MPKERRDSGRDRVYYNLPVPSLLVFSIIDIQRLNGEIGVNANARHQWKM